MKLKVDYSITYISKNNVIIQALCNLQYLLGQNLIALIFTIIKGTNPVYKVWMYNMQGNCGVFCPKSEKNYGPKLLG